MLSSLRFSKEKLLHHTIIVCMLGLAILFSWARDPRDFFINQVFLHDTFYFSELARNWKQLFFEINANVPPPFASRVGYPLFTGIISSGTGISLTLSSYLVEIIAIVAITFFLLRIMNARGVTQVTSIIFLCYFLFSWNYPLRMAGSWPAFGNSIAMFSVCMAYWVVIYSKRSDRRTSILMLAVSVLGTLIREVFLLTLLLVFAIRLGSKKIFKSGLTQSEKDDSIKSLLRFGIIPSILVYVYLQSLNQKEGDSFEFITSYLTYIWTHLHIGNFLFVLFSAHGFSILLISWILSVKQGRKLIASRLRNSEELQIMLHFCIAGLVISIVGGGDSERYLIWFYPFVSIFAAIALDFFRKECSSNGLKVAFLVFVFFLGGRVLVPNMPHMFIVQELTYCSTASVKTNYNPKVFSGPSFLEKYRLPVDQVPSMDLPSNSKIFSRASIRWEGERPMVAAKKYDCQDGKKGTYFNAYRFELNNIPIPLGFQHNQFEVYSIWSWWADWRAQAIYTLQWLLCIIIFSFVRPEQKLIE